jgi:DNA-binding response OmpR family regulator
MFEELKGKRLLAVDDEPNVLAMVKYVLHPAAVDTASSYDEARAKLLTGRYDVAVLDIMGVRGYDLLAEFHGKLPCLMLTAHSLSSRDFARAHEERAVLYLPKEEIGALDEYVCKVLASKEPLWDWLVSRLDFRRWFGPTWTPDQDGALA